MNVHQFAEFLRIQGYIVIETKSCYWYSKTSRFFFQSFPYHRDITLSKEEMREFFIKSRCVAARYLTYGDVSEKDKSLWICDKNDYELKDLKKSARNIVRRGLERCKIEKVEFSFLASKGIPLIKDTLARQNRPESSITEGFWMKLCLAAGQIPDFEAWAAFANGELASFIVLAIVDDYAYILENYSLTKYLKYFFPNNALTFQVIKEMLLSRKVKGINNGVEPFEELKGLNDFKVKMGFERKYFIQRLIVNPLASPFLNKVSLMILENIMSKSNSDYSRRIKGFISFYRRQNEIGTG